MGGRMLMESVAGSPWCAHMRGLVPVGKPFQVFLNHEVDVPREAQAVHGYSRQFLKQNGKSPRLAHQSFAEYVGGTPLAAYNLPYDYDKVLVPEWGRLGLQTGIPRGFCMMRLTQKLFSPSPAGNYKLQSLRAHFRLPEREAHSALGDVLTVVDLLGSVLLPHLQRLGLRARVEQFQQVVIQFGCETERRSRCPGPKLPDASMGDADVAIQVI